jgi:hypothetical protein
VIERVRHREYRVTSAGDDRRSAYARELMAVADGRVAAASASGGRVFDGFAEAK